MQPVPSPNKILYLESLRGIAAIMVAILHFNIGSTFNNGFISKSWLMVDFFFVLSGFVIALNYQDKVKTLTHLYQFQLRRFLRLYPLHFAMLLVFLGIEIAKLLSENIGLVATSNAFTRNDLTSFIANTFLVQNFVDGAMGWNNPSWSISAEFYTYFVFGLCLVLFARWKAAFIIACTAIALVALFVLFEKGMAPHFGFARCLYSFFLGVLAFNLFSVVNFKIPNLASYLVFLGAIYLLAQSNGFYDPASLLVPLVFTAFILVLLLGDEQNVLRRLLSVKPLVYLGTISYGIYMIHAALWWVLIQTAKFGFGIPTMEDKQGFDQLVFNSLTLSNCVMILGLACLILLAHFSYILLERPMNNFRFKLSSFQ